jgi:hypothetical protein
MQGNLSDDVGLEHDHVPQGHLRRDGYTEPRDVHRFILDRARDGPVTVTTLTRELYGVPMTAWAAPWRSRVISAVNVMAQYGRLAWVTVDGEPAATLPAAALGDPQEGAETAQEAISRVQPPLPVRSTQRRRAMVQRRAVEDLPLPG